MSSRFPDIAPRARGVGYRLWPRALRAWDSSDEGRAAVTLGLDSSVRLARRLESSRLATWRCFLPTKVQRSSTPGARIQGCARGCRAGRRNRRQRAPAACQSSSLSKPMTPAFYFGKRSSTSPFECRHSVRRNRQASYRPRPPPCRRRQPTRVFPRVQSGP
jgi:hypothetical protein